MTTKRLNLFLITCIAVALTAAWAFSAELPAPHFTPIPKFLPVPNFEAKPEAVDDLGIRDSIRIMRQCRAATANIPLPQTRAEVDSYVDKCTPFVIEIIKREIKATFPPEGTTINVPVTVKVVETAKETPRKLTKKVKSVIGSEKRCGPNGCTMEPIYGEVEVPMTPEDIKVSGVLDKFEANTLAKPEVDDLKATVPKEIIKRVMSQRWSLGTCQMACRSHGSVLYDVYNDGTEEPAKVQPDSAPQEGVSTGSGSWRLFGRRQ
jgi:hypothetical protein